MRRALELRQDGAQAAVKKIDALLARAGDDDRVRGSFRYHGAATGRWAGEGFQPQNLKRPVVDDLDAAIAAVATGDYDHVRKCIRGRFLVSATAAAPDLRGTRAYADRRRFRRIESRVLAWVAGEDGSSTPIAATTRPAIPVTSLTARPPAGFPLAAGQLHEGHAGAHLWQDLRSSFRLHGRPERLAEIRAGVFTDAEVEQFKSEWRAAHPSQQFWYAVDRAAWTAVQERGRVICCGRVAFKCSGAFLFLKLPSGRKLLTRSPAYRDRNARNQVVVFADNAAGQFKTAETATAPMAGSGPKTLSAASHAICWLMRCCGSKPPAIRSCCMCTTRSCVKCRRLRQRRRIHPPDDTQAGLGTGAADRSQAWTGSRYCK